MKMTKQVVTMVEACNMYLRNNKITDLTNETFNFMCYALGKSGCFKGFNYYRNKEINGEVFAVLDSKNPEFLQIETDRKK